MPKISNWSRIDNPNAEAGWKHDEKSRTMVLVIGPNNIRGKGYDVVLREKGKNKDITRGLDRKDVAMDKAKMWMRDHPNP
jgi:hypothetical protein